MNTISLIGRLTKKPELRYTNQEPTKAVCSFTLAVADPYTKDKTDFIYCQAWERRAEAISKYADKGDRLGVTGRLQVKNYQDKNGEYKTSANVIVETFDFLEPKKDRDGAKPPMETDFPTVDYDEIPF